MTPTDLTALIGALVAFIGSIVIPIYIARQAAKKADEKKAAETRIADHSTDVVSWQAINLAISRENETLRARLTAAENKYTDQVTKMRLQADDDLNKLKTSYDLKIADLQRQILKLSRLLTEAGGTPQRESP